MTAEYRNNSLITFIIWCSAFLTLVVILAWEFGWVSTDVPQAEISGEQPRQLVESDHKNLSDEITKAEKNSSSETGNHEVAKISDNELEKKLLEMSRPVKDTNKTRTSPVKKEMKTASAIANKPTETKEPALLIPDNPKSITQVTAKPENSENKNSEKTQLISFEKEVPTITEEKKTAIINPKQELKLSTESENPEKLLIPEDNSSLVYQKLPEEIVEIDQFLEERNFIAAHRTLSSYYWQKPELKDHVLPRIEANAHRIYFAPQPHFMEPYVVKSGDQLWQIGKRYHVTWQYLARLNQVAPEKIQPDQKIKVIKGPFSALVDLSDYTLAIHAHGYFVSEYPIGIGKDNSTPIGKFKILNKVANPQYTNPEGVVIEADDPNNPLGEHWLDLGESYGIHGTIDPDSIGKNESRGCVRMRNEDVKEVYHFLINGSEVIIRH